MDLLLVRKSDTLTFGFIIFEKSLKEKLHGLFLFVVYIGKYNIRKYIFESEFSKSN